MAQSKHRQKKTEYTTITGSVNEECSMLDHTCHLRPDFKTPENPSFVNTLNQ